MFEQAVPRFGQDADEVVEGEGGERSGDGDTAGEFGDEAVGLEVLWEAGGRWLVWGVEGGLRRLVGEKFDKGEDTYCGFAEVERVIRSWRWGIGGMRGEEGEVMWG